MAAMMCTALQNGYAERLMRTIEEEEGDVHKYRPSMFTKDRSSYVQF